MSNLQSFFHLRNSEDLGITTYSGVTLFYTYLQYVHLPSLLMAQFPFTLNFSD